MARKKNSRLSVRIGDDLKTSIDLAAGGFKGGASGLVEFWMEIATRISEEDTEKLFKYAQENGMRATARLIERACAKVGRHDQ